MRASVPRILKQIALRAAETVAGMVAVVLVLGLLAWGLLVAVPSLFDNVTRSGDVAAADASAESSSATVTGYLRGSVVDSGATPRENVEAVRQWLQDAMAPYVQYSSKPDLEILGSTDDGVDVVLRLNSEVGGFGDERAWGFACTRYTVTASNDLLATSIECPDGTSRDPAE